MGMLKIFATKGSESREVKFSRPDYLWIKSRKWYLDKDGYAFCRGEKRGTTLKMHRIVLEAKKGQEVDHINRDKLDNRRTNLRIVSHHENTLNRERGLGISFDQDRNKWRARLKFKNKEVHLGRFDTRENAIAARKEGAVKYFGQYA